MKVIIYWSLSGNTKDIAEKMASDLNCDIKEVSEISVSDAIKYDEIILGCPAMGSEELEPDVFEPFYNELIDNVSNQKIALFGSYGWGDGEWMRNWESDVEGRTGVKPLTLIVNEGLSGIDDSNYNEFISLV